MSFCLQAAWRGAAIRVNVQLTKVHILEPDHVTGDRFVAGTSYRNLLWNDVRTLKVEDGFSSPFTLLTKTMQKNKDVEHSVLLHGTRHSVWCLLHRMISIIKVWFRHTVQYPLGRMIIYYTVWYLSYRIMYATPYNIHCTVRYTFTPYNIHHSTV